MEVQKKWFFWHKKDELQVVKTEYLVFYFFPNASN